MRRALTRRKNWTAVETMKLVMTLLVMDAERILRENLEFHLAQGVDFFVITDNRSTDATATIAREYVDRGLAELVYETGDDYSQARWVTRMARRAAIHHGADWVINNDDDEFWHAGAAGLRAPIADHAQSCDALLVERYNHPPVADCNESAFFETMVFRERSSLNALGHPLPPKLCHRAFADINVSQGNHSASRSSGPLRVCRAPELTISHFPIRDYASFERKIMNGGAAYARNTELGPDVGITWRWLYALWKEGRLRSWYDAQVLPQPRVADGLSRAELVHDDFVLRTLRAAAP